MQEWLTLQEVADLIGVSYGRVRAAVANLSSLRLIITRDNPEERQILQIHRDSVPIIRQAVTGKKV